MEKSGLKIFLEFKEIINKVKGKHGEIKDQLKQDKDKDFQKNIKPNNPNHDNISLKSKKGLGLKEDIFSDPEDIFSPPEKITDYRVEKGDTLKSIAEKIYGDNSRWIMIHRTNILKIPNPYNLAPGMFLKIPEENETENNYPLKSKDSNYIIQPEDTIDTISENVFGTKTLAKKLGEWGFIKNPKDIYPGKELAGLKYLDFQNQLLKLAQKNNINVNEKDIFSQQKEILLTEIANISRMYHIPPVVMMCLSFTDNHWMSFQGFKTENENMPDKNWPPMQINDLIYSSAFPEVAMNIEKNIHLSANILKKLRESQKTWPKAIAAYILDSPLGIGKPDEQKRKVQNSIVFLEEIIVKMENKEFENEVGKKLKTADENDISFSLLYKELIKHRDYIKEKYL